MGRGGVVKNFMVNNFSFVGYVLNWPCNKTSPAGPVPCILHGMGVAVGTSQPVVHTLASDHVKQGFSRGHKASY
jgi:hypothetical protein